jgi:murein DD-endopeptidase MepM/ murein hydrolase activator NlpD
MPSKRTLLYVAATTIFAIFFALSIVPTAQAAETPSFELHFPQESEPTYFHNTFGARRSSGRRHKGNDLMAPKMTEVYAVGSGVVSTVSEGRTAGRWVEISHVDGWSSNYMHLNDDTPGTDDGRADWKFTVAPGIEVGAAVFAGQLIGYVGDSGNAEWTGSHTHFELRRNGKAVDPHYLLEDAWERSESNKFTELWRRQAELGLDQVA